MGLEFNTGHLGIALPLSECHWRVNIHLSSFTCSLSQSYCTAIALCTEAFKCKQSHTLHTI